MWAINLSCQFCSDKTIDVLPFNAATTRFFDIADNNKIHWKYIRMCRDAFIFSQEALHSFILIQKCCVVPFDKMKVVALSILFDVERIRGAQQC